MPQWLINNIPVPVYCVTHGLRTSPSIFHSLSLKCWEGGGGGKGGHKDIEMLAESFSFWLPTVSSKNLVSVGYSEIKMPTIHLDTSSRYAQIIV